MGCEREEMAFLFLGLAAGATAVALSDRDRDYYRMQGRLTMEYVGNKNGEEIYRDRSTGLYFADNGFDVRRVGRVGWKPHPVDVERLKTKLVKFQPHQVPFCGFILATFIDKEQQLWNTLFERYELPAKPKEPHFSRALRKQRFAEYDLEVQQWEAAVVAAKQSFRDECAAWDLRRSEYRAEHEHASAGTELLLMALRPTQQRAPAAPQFKVVVPEGKLPGDTIQVQAGGRMLEVMIPAGSAPGTEIQFEAPAPVQTTATALPQPPATASPAPAGSTASMAHRMASARMSSDAPPAASGGSYRGASAAAAWGWGGADAGTGAAADAGMGVGSSAAAPPPALGAPASAASPPPALGQAASPPPALGAPAAVAVPKAARPPAPNKWPQGQAAAAAPPPAAAAPPPAIQQSSSFRT